MEWLKGDYDLLYRQVREERKQVVCWTNNFGHIGGVLRDIATIEFWDFPNTIKIASRGKCYADCSDPAWKGADLEKFTKMCERFNIKWLNESCTQIK